MKWTVSQSKIVILNSHLVVRLSFFSEQSVCLVKDLLVPLKQVRQLGDHLAQLFNASSTDDS